MADNKESTMGLLKKNYKDILGRVERRLDGVSSDTLDKLVPDNLGAPLADTIQMLSKTYERGENLSISDINGKVNGYDMSAYINAQFDADIYKQSVLNNIMRNSIDKIREQQFMIRNMPQVNRVINATADLILSYATRSKQTTEIFIRGGNKTKAEIMAVLDNKNFEEHDRECVRNGLRHGAGFMYIYPYRKMAEDILELADVAVKKDKPNTNLVMNAKVDMAYGDTLELTRESGNDSYVYISEGTITKGLHKLMGTPDKNTETKYDSLIKESMTKGSSVKYEEVLSSYVQERFISSKCITEEMSLEFKERMNSDVSLYGEAASKFQNGQRLIDTSKINKIKGAYVKALEPEKVVPVYSNNNLVGLYYLDICSDFSDDEVRNKERLNARVSYGVSPRNNNFTHIGVAGEIKDAIVGTIRNQLDERFLSTNRHVIPSIEKILRDHRKLTDERFMIKWIPKEYLVEYKNHYRQSQIAEVEPFIICYIILWRNYMFKKVFYEKDKTILRYTVGADDDWQGQGYRALDSFKNFVPQVSDILNYRKMNLAMTNSNRLAIPKSIGGTVPFEVDKLEGQKPDENAFDDIVKLQSIITESVGFNYNIFDPTASVDFAAQIVAEKEEKAEFILSKQIVFNKAKNEAVSKILEEEWHDNTVDVTALYPETRAAKSNITSEEITKMKDRIEYIVSIIAGEDVAYAKWLTLKLFYEYGSLMLNLEEPEKYKEAYEIELKLKASATDGSTASNETTNVDTTEI